MGFTCVCWAVTLQTHDGKAHEQSTRILGKRIPKNGSFKGKRENLSSSLARSLKEEEEREDAAEGVGCDGVELRRGVGEVQIGSPHPQHQPHPLLG